MTDNFDKVVAAIPHWKPSKEFKVFGVSAIQQICGCNFKEAMRIKKQLKIDGHLPEAKW